MPVEKGRVAYQATIYLDSDDLLCLLQQLNCQIPCTRSNFQDHVGGLQPSLVHYRLYYEWIPQDMLALALEELDT